MTPVRFGLVGYGFGGRYFHAPLLAAASECELVGVVTTSDQRREQVERELPGVPVVGAIEELDGAEAVAISTPADTHSALTDAALRGGLAVVCDKPFALDAGAALRSVELAEELGRPLSPYQNRRWDSDFLTVRGLVDDGVLGEVTRFESRFERFAPDAGPGAAGAGTLLDFGSHVVDQALVLLGPVATVYAEFRVRDSGLDDDVFIALTHVNGARSHLWGGWQQHAPGPRFRVTGTAATAVVDGDDGQEAALIAGEDPGAAGGPPALLHRDGDVVEVPRLRGSWDAFYPAFARAVRGEGPVPVAPRDAVATATVLDAARVAATSGTGVALPVS